MIYLIGTWHDYLETVFHTIISQLADINKDINFLSESRKNYNKDRYMESKSASLLGWLTEFILVSKDPLCMYPTCHGFECDMSTKKYYAELFWNIVFKLELLCNETKDCPPNYEANPSDWFAERDAMQQDTYILDPNFILEKFIYPTLEWLATLDSIDLSLKEWDQMFKQIDYIIYNNLCEEDFLVVRDFLSNFPAKARERYFARLIADKYLYGNQTIYVQVGALHLKGLIDELNTYGIEDIMTMVLKTKQDLIDFFASNNLLSRSVMEQFTSKLPRLS